MRRGCEGRSIPRTAAFCCLRKEIGKLKAATSAFERQEQMLKSGRFCCPVSAFVENSRIYKRPPPEGARRSFAPQSCSARPFVGGRGGFRGLFSTQIPAVTPPLAARCLTRCEPHRRSSAEVSRRRFCRFWQARLRRTDSAPLRARSPL